MTDASAAVLPRNIAAVRERVAVAAARAGRDALDVRLIAVTKGHGADAVRAAVDAGLADIGENRVQEAAAKIDATGRTVRWHLIGHLQTNKAGRAAALFDAVHTIDSERVARALALHRDGDRDPLAALVEVDYTGMPARTGVREAEAEALIRAVIGLPGLHVVGLMTVPAPSPDRADTRAAFARLRTLRDQIEAATGWPLPELSMGMSDDYDVAVEEGATMIRLGRALFGARS